MERYYVTITQLVLARWLSVIKLSPRDDFGVYTSGSGSNRFGTSLMVRGTEDEVMTFLVDHQLTHPLPVR